MIEINGHTYTTQADVESRLFTAEEIAEAVCLHKETQRKEEACSAHERKHEMNKKLYILHYPSMFGMGSNSDTLLVSDEDLRYIIREEVGRKKDDHFFSERLTGTWNGEVFCDSGDISEIEEDVIRKRMNSCSTYDGVNDLIELPAGIQLTTAEQKEENSIFHIWNEYMSCFNDIIAGETVFTRYFLDLTGYGDLSGLHGDKIHEFVSFDMKRVLRNSYFMNTIDMILDMEENRAHRFESKLNGTYKVGEGKYLDDLTDQDDEKLYRLYKKEWEETAARFAEPITCPDTYLEHIYMGSPESRFSRDLRHDIKKIMSKHDHRQFAYDHPFHTSEPGAVFSGLPGDTRYFRYDELFRTGCDIKYLPAVNTGSYASKDEIKSVEAFLALRNVFGDL